jgi:hypothetical protein
MGGQMKNDMLPASAGFCAEPLPELTKKSYLMGDVLAMFGHALLNDFNRFLDECFDAYLGDIDEKIDAMSHALRCPAIDHNEKCKIRSRMKTLEKKKFKHAEEKWEGGKQ